MSGEDPEVIIHDPDFAYKCYRAAVEVGSRYNSVSEASYIKWLQNYVYPLAEALGVIYVVPTSGKRSHTPKRLCVRIPNVLKTMLEEMARKKNTEIDVLVSRAIARFIVEEMRKQEA